MTHPFATTVTVPVKGARVSHLPIVFVGPPEGVQIDQSALTWAMLLSQRYKLPTVEVRITTLVNFLNFFHLFCGNVPFEVEEKVLSISAYLGWRIEGTADLPRSNPLRKLAWKGVGKQAASNEFSYLAQYFEHASGNLRSLKIPFFPEELANRLIYLKEAQELNYPLDLPLRAMNPSDRTNDEDMFPLVYPLMRDPTYHDGRAVSREKVFRWWKQLLRHCEVVYNKQRKVQLGNDHVHFSFFYKDGSPIWDIHSIRVSFVTNLLEQETSPSIVQMAVGHLSPTVTLHYRSEDHAKLHQVLSEAHDKLLRSIDKDILAAESEEELEKAVERAFGGIVSLAGNEGLALAKENLRGATNFANGKEPVSVFSHGICPGGVCREGGTTKGTVRTGVHRSKACSRCRFRITGPAFIRGLIMNANLIMKEIGESTRADIKINSEIRAARRNNEPTAHLESRKHQELEFRGELFADWAAEYQTIRNAIEMIAGSNGSSNLPSQLPELRAVIRHEHHFNLLQDVLDCAVLIPGGELDILDSVRDSRDKILLEILRKNGDVRHLLLISDEVLERNSLDQFGQLLSKLDRTSTDEDLISALLDGSLQLPNEIFAVLKLEGDEDD